MGGWGFNIERGPITKYDFQRGLNRAFTVDGEAILEFFNLDPRLSLLFLPTSFLGSTALFKIVAGRGEDPGIHWRNTPRIVFDVFDPENRWSSIEKTSFDPGNEVVFLPCR